MPLVCDLDDLSSSHAREQLADCSTTSIKKYPTKRDVLAVIPAECFERSLLTSSLYLLASLTMTIGSGVLAYAFLPLTWA